MRIGIDGRYTEASQMGTGSYSENAIRELLAEIGPDDEIIVWTGSASLPRDCARRIRQERIPDVPRDPGSSETEQLLWMAALERAHIDVFWSPTGILPTATPCASVVTIHDTHFIDHPEWFSPGLQAHLAQEVPRSLRQATRVIAISEYTRQSVMKQQFTTSDRIDVITQGVHVRFHENLSANEVATHLSTLHVVKPYLLLLSNHAPHKNSAFALEVMAAWRDRHPTHVLQLVIAGGGPAPHQPIPVNALIQKYGLNDKCRSIGRVPSELLPSLYAGASGLLCTSLGEGWGLPPIEALMLGVPSIVSDRGALPESMDAIATIVPLEISRWVTAIEQLINDGIPSHQAIAMQERRNQLQCHNARDLLACLRSAAEEPSRSSSAFISAARHALPSIPGPTDLHQLPGAPHAPDAPSAALDCRAQPATNASGISGCTIIRNGVDLGYPFEASIASYASICDEIVLCWDPTSEDGTRDLVKRIAARYPQVVLLESAWDMSNRKGGSELARQTQIAFSRCSQSWTFYVQADEALHEDWHDELKSLVKRDHILGIGIERRSFLRTLDREIRDHRVAGLVRLFRSGCGTSVGDAMQCELRGTGKLVLSQARLFNYSRLGTDAGISHRTKNLHHFYEADDATAIRADDEHTALATVPFCDTHPQPIERQFRKRPPVRGLQARIAVNMIARETDHFGALILTASLESLQGYADQIVLVDHGLCQEARAHIHRLRSELPLVILDGHHLTTFSDLRNFALEHTHASMTHVHKIDSDEVYFPSSLAETKQLIEISNDHGAFTSSFAHCMIEPTLVESQQTKTTIFRRDQTLRWHGSVHESIIDEASSSATPATFMHLGYCRPQWQIFLKWLHYAHLAVGHVDHFRWEFIDGVRFPYCRHQRNPNTILDVRRPHLTRWTKPYPLAMKSMLEGFRASQSEWGTWLNSVTPIDVWTHWQSLAAQRGGWEHTLDEMLERYQLHESPAVAVARAVGNS